MAPTPSPAYQRLRRFIAERMRMSHIYQPLMLMELLGRSSPATAEDIARRILGEDVTQIDVYRSASSGWCAGCSTATPSRSCSRAATG
ncbi:hypothetical protein [Synechococcus sp. CBW1004]|uniref:hypothetical protein n=1 Tax=Synechococcus sp. CBW1004 TaxID=1353136 RepID=UPI0018CD2E1C|nr:hypothetical protein [Synechococcus sp. CBW1004]QPN62020.1 hypothetical protein H8F25_09450 [Synechococcus sp. CBW1004]